MTFQTEFAWQKEAVSHGVKVHDPVKTNKMAIEIFEGGRGQEHGLSIDRQAPLIPCLGEHQYYYYYIIITLYFQGRRSHEVVSTILWDGLV